MSSAIGWVIFAVVVLAIIIVFLARFYKRATREVSIIKTGVGGRKVIMDGGTIAIPYFHEISRVNMQTLRLHVDRTGNSSVITKDRLRVDVGAEFYVSVIPDREGISRAAQTLGRRTFQPEQLGDLIEGKLIDAIRSVAAGMTLDELHENRGKFVADVGAGLTETLARNGLELDSVSLTGLDQTPFAALDENNAFNAVGMRRLAEVVAKSKKDRAEIDADADVSVRRAAMEAARQTLEIDLQEQEAQIFQVQKIEELKAAQLAEVAKRKADGESEAAHARIEMEQKIRTTDIAREQSVRTAEIAKERELKAAEIAHELSVEVANQDRQIILAQKSQETNKARALADLTMADAVKASEEISTVRRLSEADRRKQLALMEAEQKAEIAGTHMRIQAKAEQDTAGAKAAAALELAKGDAAAQNVRSAARKVEMVAEADGQRALTEAENTISDRLVVMRMNRNRLEALPKIVAEMVKPAEKIDSIKIHHVTGLGARPSAGDGSGDGAGASGGKSVINQAMDSILDMAVQLPALKKIGEEIGFTVDGSIAGAVEGMLESSEKGKPDTGGH
jgi:flotillin